MPSNTEPSVTDTEKRLQHLEDEMHKNALRRMGDSEEMRSLRFLVRTMATREAERIRRDAVEQVSAGMRNQSLAEEMLRRAAGLK